MAKKESKQKVGFLMVGLKFTQDSEQCYMVKHPPPLLGSRAERGGEAGRASRAFPTPEKRRLKIKIQGNAKTPLELAAN